MVMSKSDKDDNDEYDKNEDDKNEDGKNKKGKVNVNVPPDFGYSRWENLSKNVEKNWRQRQRAGMLWFGLFLVAVGALWYAINLGIIKTQFVCPGLIIIVGAIVLLKALLSYIHH